MKIDPIENPAHYTGNGAISCMDALDSMMHPMELPNTQAYWWGCAFKYLWRWPLKNGKQDLLKARQCIDYLLDEIGDDE